MTRLRTWFDQCAELWKATKPKSEQELADLATRMDQDLGAWSEGSRAEAAKHYARLGSKTALGSGAAAPGTPEHQAHLFAKDLRRHSRRSSIARPVQVSGDTLTGKIDEAHLKHYAGKWASHNTVLEYSSRGATSNAGEHARSLAPWQTSMQMRSHIVHKRMGQMKRAQVDPIATMDDLNTIHTGVERAIHAGKIPESTANRYHVMRAAMKIVHAQHHDPEFPAGVPFKPSYAAMDTEALKAMHVGVQHLDDQGFKEAKQRLTPVLTHAVESHTSAPFVSRTAPRSVGKKSFTVQGMSYPDLHVMGSLPHKKQESADRMLSTALENARSKYRRSRTSQPAATPAAPPTPKAVEAPAAPDLTYDDYKRRTDAGEQFSPDVHVKMSRLRMKKSLTTAVGTALLVRAWKDWRAEVE